MTYKYDNRFKHIYRKNIYDESHSFELDTVTLIFCTLLTNNKQSSIGKLTNDEIYRRQLGTISNESDRTCLILSTIYHTIIQIYIKRGISRYGWWVGSIT